MTLYPTIKGRRRGINMNFSKHYKDIFHELVDRIDFMEFLANMAMKRVQNLTMNVLQLLIINEVLDCKDLLTKSIIAAPPWPNHGTAVFLVDKANIFAISNARGHETNGR